MKTQRHAAILKIVGSAMVASQEQLRERLKEAGFDVTQATLSRDIRELGLAKTAEGYQEVGAPGGPDLATIAAEFLWDARAAQNLVVLKTSPAHASTLAVALDQEEWPEIVGTIAGDDTVLVIAPDSETAVRVRDRLLGFARG